LFKLVNFLTSGKTSELKLDLVHLLLQKSKAGLQVINDQKGIVALLPFYGFDFKSHQVNLLLHQGLVSALELELVNFDLKLDFCLSEFFVETIESWEV